MTDKIFHWFKEKYSLFLNVSMALFFVDVMVDPTNLIFHVKYMLFGLVFFIWFLRNYNKKLVLTRFQWFILLFIAFFMPFYGLSVGLINSVLHNIPMGNLVYFNSFFFFALFIVTLSEKMDLIPLFNYSSFTIVLMTLGTYLMLIFSPGLFGDLYKYFVIDKQVMVYALRNYGQTTFLMIFYKTSPLLVFPLSYYLYRLLIVRQRKYLFLNSLLLVLTALTLYFSGTRANLISLIFIIVFYLGYAIYRKSKIWFLFFIAFGILIAFSLLPSIVTTFFSKQEVSNVKKLEHLFSYFNYFNHHLLSLLFGQGIGGIFYASGLHRFINESELTYLELIRIWGGIIAFIFVVIILLPLFVQIKTKRLSHVFIAYLAYLFIVGTNPLLLSSTGMLMLVYVFSISFGNYGVLKRDGDEPESDKNRKINTSLHSPVVNKPEP